MFNLHTTPLLLEIICRGLGVLDLRVDPRVDRKDHRGHWAIQNKHYKICYVQDILTPNLIQILGFMGECTTN